MNVHNPVTVNALNKSFSKQQGYQKDRPRCSVCTLFGHEGKYCDVECFTCGQKKHISKYCPKRPKPEGSSNSKTVQYQKKKSAHMVEEEESSEDDWPIKHVSMISDVAVQIREEVVCRDVIACEDQFDIFDNELQLLIDCADDFSGSWNDFGKFDEIGKFDSINTVSMGTVAKSISEDVRSVSVDVVKSDSGKVGKLGLLGKPTCDQSWTECPSDVDRSINRLVSEYQVSDELISQVHGTKGGKPMIEILMNGVSTPMEVDSGSQVTVMSMDSLKRLGIQVSLNHPGGRYLKTANGSRERVAGTAMVNVQFREVSSKLELTVVEGEFETLLGRNWFSHLFGESWLERLIGVNSVSRERRSIEELKKSVIFNTELGTVKGVEAQIILRKGHQPKYMRSRSLPFAIKDRVIQEINSMVEQGILERVEDSEYATPIVPIIKGSKVRICGDYKSTINQDIVYGNYTIPTTEECFSKMTGCKYFTLIDVKKAYNNIKIKKEDQIFTTITTPIGLFKWLR